MRTVRVRNALILGVGIIQLQLFIMSSVQGAEPPGRREVAEFSSRLLRELADSGVARVSLELTGGRKVTEALNSEEPRPDAPKETGEEKPPEVAEVAKEVKREPVLSRITELPRPSPATPVFHILVLDRTGSMKTVVPGRGSKAEIATAASNLQLLRIIRRDSPGGRFVGRTRIAVYSLGERTRRILPDNGVFALPSEVAKSPIRVENTGAVYLEAQHDQGGTNIRDVFRTIEGQISEVNDFPSEPFLVNVNLITDAAYNRGGDPTDAIRSLEATIKKKRGQLLLSTYLISEVNRGRDGEPLQFPTAEEVDEIDSRVRSRLSGDELSDEMSELRGIKTLILASSPIPEDLIPELNKFQLGGNAVNVTPDSYFFAQVDPADVADLTTLLDIGSSSATR